MKKVLLFLLIVLAACSQQFVCPDGTIVTSSADCTAPEPPTPSEPETVTPPPVVEPDPEPEPVAVEWRTEITELFERHESKVKSYSFLHVPIEEQSGVVRQFPEHHYYVRGDLMRVDRNRPQSVDPETYYDTIYVDLAQKTAFGYCLNSRIGTCADEGAERDAAYKDWIIKLPPQYFADVKNDAQIVGTVNFQNREVQRVRWTDNGLYAEMYVDDFMGMPMRVAYYADEEYGELVEGVEFQEITFNVVKDEDVTR